MCAASWGRCSRGPGYVRRGFPSSLFLFSVDGAAGGGSACSFVPVSVYWCYQFPFWVTQLTMNESVAEAVSKFSLLGTRVTCE